MSTQPYRERATVTICIWGDDVRPMEVTERLGLKPTFVIAGTWCLETNSMIPSRDLVAHPRIASGDAVRGPFIACQRKYRRSCKE